MNTEAPRLRYDNVSVVYPGGQRIALDIEVRSGEFFGLMGPSGSGKSTGIKVAAGLIRSRRQGAGAARLPVDALHTGAFRINDVDASDWEPARRQVAVIGQSANLYPHLTVRQNLGLISPDGLDAEALDQLTGELGIGHTLDRHPDEISGGEAQRVALAKAMVNRARSILWDEPFNGLDQLRRLDLTELLRAFHRRHRPTTIFVSHDQETLLALADRIAFLYSGRVLQIGSPTELLRTPEHVEVARAMDPGYRVRLPVEHRAGGFESRGLQFRGPKLPDGTREVVVDTRQLAHAGDGSVWRGDWSEQASEVFGGQPVRLLFPSGDARPWRVPLNGTALANEPLIPRGAVWCFDAEGKILA